MLGRLLTMSLVLVVFACGADSAAADASSPWSPGPNAIGDDTFVGVIDAPGSVSTVTRNSNVVVRGWIVDRTADGWTGIDDVQIYRDLQGQGGEFLLVRASIGIPRDDVASALGNPFWANAGYTAAFSDAGLVVGSNPIAIYIHAPDKGWWYQQIDVQVQPLPAIAYADDPLLVVQQALPSLTVDHAQTTITLRGYAIDRNLPSDQKLGVGGSGVARIRVFLDGPRGTGTLLGEAELGRKNRDPAGFGQRFTNGGWQFIIRPPELTVDKHVLFIYAASAYWPNEALVIVPFNVR
jgi:hypothetical protein